MSRILIIGAGIGGLTAAALLARAGHAVTVAEARPAPGGKLRQLHPAGVAVDAGPTVLTMRWVFDELFAAAGGSFDDLPLRRLGILARHAWDADRLDLHADLAASTEAVAAFAGTAEARRFAAFMAEAARTYTTLADTFIAAPRTDPLGLSLRIARRDPRRLATIRPFETLTAALARAFTDARLRQLFARYATYSGASPYAAPATLMLIAHVEQAGVWTIDGGLHGLARALVALAGRHGATFRYDAPVAAVLAARGRAAGVRLASGEVLDADAVIANADPQALGLGLFGPVARVAAYPPAARSLSAVTFTLNAPARGFPLVRHNVFFSPDYPIEFAAIAAGRLPADPTVYVAAQDRTDAAVDNPAPERLHLIVNAPANGDARAWGEDELAQCWTSVARRLAASGLSIAATPDNIVTTSPTDFATLFPATGGALYGRASHGWRASFQRPGARTRLPGLYLAGGGTHPGAGLPMAALSGIQAARALMADRAST